MCEDRIPHWIKGLEYKNVEANLKHFRQALERGERAPIETQLCNAAMLLHDAMRWMGLGEPQIHTALGEKAWTFVLENIALQHQMRQALTLSRTSDDSGQASTPEPKP